MRKWPVNLFPDKLHKATVRKLYTVLALSYEMTNTFIINLYTEIMLLKTNLQHIDNGGVELNYIYCQPQPAAKPKTSSVVTKRLSSIE